MKLLLTKLKSFSSHVSSFYSKTADSQKLFNIQMKRGILDQWDLTVGGAYTETEAKCSAGQIVMEEILLLLHHNVSVFLLGVIYAFLVFSLILLLPNMKHKLAKRPVFFKQVL